MHIGEVFDQMADEYTAIMESMVPHYRHLITTMLTGLDPDFQVGHMIDLGCGNGNVAAMCRAQYPTAELLLIDASAEMLDRCRDRFGSHLIQFQQTFFEEMDVLDGAFDLIVAGFSVHHVPGESKAALFKKLWRALRPGGVFTSADLFVNKSDQQYHSEVISDWQKFVLSNDRTLDDWQWLADHYVTYDRPSAFADQKAWLYDAGFGDIRLTWNEGPWGCFHAVK